MNSKHFGFWELYRKGPSGILEFRKINSLLPKKSTNFIELRHKKNEFNDFVIYKTSAGNVNPIKAKFQAIGNEIHVYFDDSYKDVILKIKKNDGKSLQVIDNTNGLGLQ